MAQEGPERIETANSGVSRRGFLLRLGVALNVIAASLVTVPIIGFVFSSLRERVSQAWIPLGALEDFPGESDPPGYLHESLHRALGRVDSPHSVLGPAAGRREVSGIRHQLHASRLPGALVSGVHSLYVPLPRRRLL